MSHQFPFDSEQLKRIFPCHILVNNALEVISLGNAISNSLDIDKGFPFSHYFQVAKPNFTLHNFEDLIGLCGQPLLVQSCKGESITLFGHFQFLAEGNEMLFVGVPSEIGKVNHAERSAIEPHSLQTKMNVRHILRTGEISKEEITDLFGIIKKQRKELRKANEKINEIALFTAENPDPIVRINKKGEIVNLNIAAESLKVIVYDEKVYNRDEFFKAIIPLVLKAEIRSIIEVKSNERDYSFVCLPVLEEGYINLYGRDTTQYTAQQLEFELISKIVKQTNSAVWITDTVGNIKWVNAAFENITGYALDEIVTRRPEELLKGKDTDINTLRYMKAQLENNEPFACELYNYTKSGEGIWSRINCQPIFDKAGKVSHFCAFLEDITKEKLAQERIKRDAARLSSLITNLHAGILLENENGTIALVNQEFCRQFAINSGPEELIGSESNLVFNQIKQQFSYGQTLVSVCNQLKQNGTLSIGNIQPLNDGRYFEQDYIPIWNSGRYEGHLWMFTDVTEKITLEVRLGKQRRFYEQILDNIPSDIVVFDNEHRYIYLNPKGVKDNELRQWLIGKTDEEYINYRNKPIALLEKRRNAFNRLMKTKQLQSWEEKMPQEDGSIKHILRNMFPVMSNDEDVKWVIGYGVDISEIRNIQQKIELSEKRYRDVIDNSLALIITHNLDGKIITANPRMFELFGFTEQDMIGHSLSEFMPNEDKVSFYLNYLKNIRKLKRASGIFRVVNKQGEIIYCLYNNYLKEEIGQEPYVIGFAVDITDRIAAEKELKVAKKITEQLVRAQQSFLANMSHEIRTPMNAIMGMAGQLSKTNLNNDQSFYLNTIRSASENLLVIINDILDLTKIEEGKLTLEDIGFNMKDLLNRSLEVMRHKAEEKGLLLDLVFCDRRVNSVLIGDPFRLNQVLLNFLSNAIKFTAKGRVDVSCIVLDDNATCQTVELSVKDTGKGIEEEFLARLFDKFSQEDVSITRKFGGTGLGMSISKDIIELMGGQIKVRSKKERGTTVIATITFQKGTLDDMPIKVGGHFNSDILRNKRILLTDDNEMNRLVASMMLKNYGVEIDEAKNGVEAIEKLRLNVYDLVLMDVQMPVMDGVLATDAIRNTMGLTVPIIALTAMAIKGDEERFLNAGMNGYLSKPFEENQLLSVVTKWLESAENMPAPTPIPIVKKELYDLSKLQDLARGDKEFVKKMVKVFEIQVATSLSEFKEGYNDNDFDKIRKVAHRMKPSIDNMGIVSLKNEMREIEKCAVEYGKSEQLEVLLAKVESVLLQVMSELSKRYDIV